MKNISLSALLLCVLLPPSVFAEEIRSFDATINVHTDSSFTVTETIVYDFKDDDRHGIFRFIPTTHPQESRDILHERYVDIAVARVVMDGEVVSYTVTDERGQVYLKIGDPDETITGVHTYGITYTVRGGLSYLENNAAELYWNVTGNEWDVPIQSVSVILIAEPEVLTDERACYQGVSGAIDRCYAGAPESGEVSFIATELKRGGGMTIAHGIDAERVDMVVLERLSLFWFWFIGICAWLIGLGVYIHRYQMQYKTKRPVIAQYEPYRDVKPMYTGLLIDGRLDAHDITAGIVYLAEQGFLRIKKIDSTVLFLFTVNDYEVTLTRTPDESLTAFQHSLIALLFGTNASIESKVTLGDLKKDMEKQRENVALLTALRSDLADDLKQVGFYQDGMSFIFNTGRVVLLLAVAMGVLIFFGAMHPALLFVPAASFGVLFIAYRRRTQKGYEAQNHLEGFKLFLSVTDKERFAFHNAPEKSPEQFMKYLPYAIAFGVEEKWANVFADITMPVPDWYDGGGHGYFSAVTLTSSLNGFSTAFVSGTGTSSASGGGGVSGGGAGGGGGGSW